MRLILIIVRVELLAHSCCFSLSLLRPNADSWAGTKEAGDLQRPSQSLTLLYHVCGSPLHLDVCYGCPLHLGHRLMVCGRALCFGHSHRSLSLLKLEWSLQDLLYRGVDAAEGKPLLEQYCHPRLGPILGSERMILDELFSLTPRNRPPKLWLEAKALELLSYAVTTPCEDGQSRRRDLLDTERAERVCAILDLEFVNPPSLSELARRVGCSPFHLSRTFSKVVGMSIPQYARKRRIEKAAELLRGGRHNVTEAAFAVGYSSLGHFSVAFREIMGCCPGLYPLVVPGLFHGGHKDVIARKKPGVGIGTGGD